MSLSRQQLSAYWSISDMDHTTLGIYVSLVLGMKNNVHSVLKFIFCALCPPVYLATHAVTHFDTGARHSSHWCKDTMGYTPPLLLFQGWSQLRVSTSSQKHQRYLPRDPAPICPPLSPFPGKVGRGRALHGAHQWESAEGSVLPCVHPAKVRFLRRELERHQFLQSLEPAAEPVRTLFCTGRWALRTHPRVWGTLGTAGVRPKLGEVLQGTWIPLFLCFPLLPCFSRNQAVCHVWAWV